MIRRRQIKYYLQGMLHPPLTTNLKAGLLTPIVVVVREVVTVLVILDAGGHVEAAVGAALLYFLLDGHQ